MKTFLLIILALINLSCFVVAAPEPSENIKTHSCPDSLLGSSSITWVLAKGALTLPWRGIFTRQFNQERPEKISLKQAVHGLYEDWGISCIYESPIVQSTIGQKIRKEKCLKLKDAGSGPHFKCALTGQFPAQKAVTVTEKSVDTFQNVPSDTLATEPVPSNAKKTSILKASSPKSTLAKYTCPQSLTGEVRHEWGNNVADIPKPWEGLGNQLLKKEVPEISKFMSARLAFFPDYGISCIYESTTALTAIGMNVPVRKCKILEDKGAGPHFECNLTNEEMAVAKLIPEAGVNSPVKQPVVGPDRCKAGGGKVLTVQCPANQCHDLCQGGLFNEALTVKPTTNKFSCPEKIFGGGKSFRVEGEVKYPWTDVTFGMNQERLEPTPQTYTFKSASVGNYIAGLSLSCDYQGINSIGYQAVSLDHATKYTHCVVVDPDQDVTHYSSSTGAVHFACFK